MLSRIHSSKFLPSGREESDSHFRAFKGETMKRTAFLILFTAAAVLSSAADISGFADSSIRSETESGRLIGGETRLRYKIESEPDSSYLRASFDIAENTLTEEKRCEIHELYAEYSSELWDLTVGRKIHVWGKADGVRITDIINPCDYTEYMTRDLDDMRIPLESVKLSFYTDNGEIELIWIPFFKKPVLPEKESPWYCGIESDSEEPDKKLSNSEAGIRTSFYFSGIDVALSAFHTWEDLPVDKYRRLDFIGAEFSKPIGSFVIRNENALFMNKHFYLEPGGSSSEKRYLKSLAGIDWYGSSSTVLMFQYGINHIIDYSSSISADKCEYYITFTSKRKFFRELLELGNSLYYNFSEEDGYSRFSGKYFLTDSLNFSAGYDRFFRDFKENTSVWLKAEYSF